MARDNHIIRPDRLTRPTKAPPQELTRHERIKLLVSVVLPDVRARIDARNAPVPSRHKR